MLLNEDPGEPHEYGITAVALIDWATRELIDGVVFHPVRVRKEGARGYVFAFCGCAWMYVVASHLPPAARNLELKADGSLTVPVVDIMKFGPLTRFLDHQSKL
ncbi:MAG: hypothetical protein K8R59_15750 [Thermoanaerobaculales bacterium]|nr:hypothetical protein [Thermoanaerobaculales bacterium]